MYLLLEDHMSRAINTTCLFVLLVLLCLPPAAFAASSPEAAPALSRAELKDMLRQVFRENPELVLDVLREHSIAVLEIAQKGSQERQYKAMRAQWQEDLKNPKQVSHDRPILGNPKAPVTIVAYSDYTCPYCASASDTIKQVMAARKNTVRFIFKNYPLKSHPLARLAAEYAVAAFVLDESKGWAYHDALFAGQDRLLKEGEGFLRAEALALGFNLQKLSAEIKSRKVKTVIDEDIAEGQALGVPGTPYHLVNNLTVRGGVPLPAFLEAVDTALAARDGAQKK